MSTVFNLSSEHLTSSLWLKRHNKLWADFKMYLQLVTIKSYKLNPSFFIVAKEGPRLLFSDLVGVKFTRITVISGLLLNNTYNKTVALCQIATKKLQFL